MKNYASGAAMLECSMTISLIFIMLIKNQV